MDECDLETEHPAAGRLVDQLDAVGLESGELRAEIGGFERDVVDARPALREELADRRVGAERGEQFDAGVPKPQRRRLDALVLDTLTVLERGAEERRPARDRGVQVVDGDPDVVDASGHETTASTVAMRTPPPRQSTMQACDRSSSMPHDASSTNVTL